MAIGVENYLNVSPVTGAYPKGQITDDPTGIAGTPVNVNTYGDMHQFLMKLLDLAAIPASGNPENATNGYQYIQALSKLIDTGFPYPFGAGATGAWLAGGTPTITAVGGGTFTGYTFTYNKYKIVGRTVYWSMQITGGTITGTVSELKINTPTALLTSGVTWANINQKMTVNGDFVTPGSPAAPYYNYVAMLDSDGSGQPIIRVAEPGTGNFPASGGYNFYINIIAEKQ